MTVAEGFIINSWGDEVPAKELRVFRVLDINLDPLTSDFTILGFRKIAPHYDRGRKVKAEYKCVQYDDLVVEKIFRDIRDPQTGRLTDLEVTFNWYCEDGTIGLTKTEIVKELNKSQAETVERKRRARAIDFLVSEARYTANEAYINILMDHYDSEITKFISKNSSQFNDALNAETDPTILTILSARVPFASDHTYTVPIKESIQYQIGALGEASLLATLELA